MRMGVASKGSGCRKGGELKRREGEWLIEPKTLELLFQVCQKPLGCVEWRSDMISLPFKKLIRLFLF